MFIYFIFFLFDFLSSKWRHYAKLTKHRARGRIAFFGWMLLGLFGTVTHPDALHHRDVFVLVRLEGDAAGTVVGSHCHSCPSLMCMCNNTAIECFTRTLNNLSPNKHGWQGPTRKNAPVRPPHFLSMTQRKTWRGDWTQVLLRLCIAEFDWPCEFVASRCEDGFLIHSHQQNLSQFVFRTTILRIKCLIITYFKTRRVNFGTVLQFGRQQMSSISSFVSLLSYC